MNTLISYNKAKQDNINQMKFSNIIKHITGSFICLGFCKVRQMMKKIRSCMAEYDIILWIMGNAGMVVHNLICISYFLFGGLYGIFFLYSEPIKYWFRVDLYHYLIVIITFMIVTIVVITVTGIEKIFYWGIVLSYFLSVCVLSAFVSNKSYILFNSFIVTFIIFLSVNLIMLLYRKRGRKFKNITLTLLRISIKSMVAGCIVIPIVSCIYFSRTTIECLKRNWAEKIAIQKVQVSENYFADNESVFKKFKEDSWSAMTLREKEIAASELCQINLLYLLGHKDENLRFVIGEDYSPLASGFYSENFHEIVADFRYADNRDDSVKFCSGF